jgi:hypothetical protein
MNPSKRLRRELPAEGASTSEPQVVRHPDGYYWLSDLHEVGPFASLDDARADMQAAEMAEPGVEPGETLEQAEDDIGVDKWIDPDTGAPSEEQRPRIEDR